MIMKKDVKENRQRKCLKIQFHLMSLALPFFLACVMTIDIGSTGDSLISCIMNNLFPIIAGLMVVMGLISSRIFVHMSKGGANPPYSLQYLKSEKYKFFFRNPGWIGYGIVAVSGDGIHVSQSAGHHSGDHQQGDRQPEDIKGSVFFFHFASPPFFLGAPNLVGRPIRSSSTTQQFITRMA